jgi:hypothetical protein
MATDEDLLIEAARQERRNRRTGRNPLLALVVAAVFAAIGWVRQWPLIGNGPGATADWHQTPTW